MKLTAETITDAQIRALMGARPFHGATYTTARVALGERRPFPSMSRATARGRCAEILNARSGT